MRCPRKLYVVVSRKSRADLDVLDIEFSRKSAELEAKRRNDFVADGATDWRVETFCKGD